MAKHTTIVLLIFLNTVITLLIGAALKVLYIHLLYMFLAAFAGVGLLFGQIALSLRTYKLFNSRYGISVKRYVLYAALPAAALSLLANIVMNIRYTYITPEWIGRQIVTVYAAAYLIVLSGRLAEFSPDSPRKGGSDE